MSGVVEDKGVEAVEATIVEALRAVADSSAKVLASVAKGRFVRGHYAPSEQAAEITRSVSFTQPGRLLTRFSMEGGNSKVPDTNKLVLLDHPGNPAMDVTVRWPSEDERESILPGTITINEIEEDNTCNVSNFDPGTLADGVGYPPDEMFAARLKMYRISLAKRQ
jgi:catalase